LVNKYIKIKEGTQNYMNNILKLKLLKRDWWSGEIVLDHYAYYETGWRFPWILGSDTRLMFKDE
jgi:hypothetical protein